MEKIKTILRQTEFHILLFILSILLFSYPLLVMTNRASAGIVILSLFGPWLIIIISLFFISRSYEEISHELTSDSNGEEHDV